jgi:hypothetical protein
VLDHLLVLLLLVAVVVSAAVVAGLIFRDLVRRQARLEVRRFLEENPPLPQLGQDGPE